VIGEFNGGTITSDGGVLLLKEIDEKRKVTSQFAACFIDHRNKSRIEHQSGRAGSTANLYTGSWVTKTSSITISCEVTHYWPQLVGKTDPTGNERRRATDRGNALAGKSTLNRLELRTDDPEKDGRYKKIAASKMKDR
jgi:hypothetical protein